MRQHLAACRARDQMVCGDDQTSASGEVHLEGEWLVIGLVSSGVL
jgi:hypothetical protein